MAKIKRIVLDKHLNPIERHNFNTEFEFSSIRKAFEAFHKIEDKCENRIDIRCNSCFIIPFNEIFGWYLKFVVED